MLSANAALLDGASLAACLDGVGHLLSRRQIAAQLARDSTFLYQVIINQWVWQACGVAFGDPLWARSGAGRPLLACCTRLHTAGQPSQAVPPLPPPSLPRSSSRWRGSRGGSGMPSIWQTCTEGREPGSAAAAASSVAALCFQPAPGSLPSLSIAL